jgi:membrane-associated phospholipid phosphatase
MKKSCLLIFSAIQFVTAYTQIADSSILISAGLPEELNTVVKENDDQYNVLNLTDSNTNSKKAKKIKPIKTVLLSVAYAGLTYLTYHHLDTKISNEFQKKRSSFKSGVANSVSWLGLGATQSIGLGSTAIFSFLAEKKKLQKTVIIWGSSLIINSFITDQLKKTFQRHRPDTGDPYNTFDWRGGPKTHKSLPSAHTSNAFTTATVFSTVYSENKWVAPVAYGLATLVGISRIYDNAHWTSDVLMGAGIGFLSAKLMVYLYNRAEKKFTFLPNISRSYSSISILCSL